LKVTAAARVALAAGLTGYLLWRSDPALVFGAVAGASWLPVVAAVLLVLVDRALMAYRWVALLYALEPGRRPPLASLLRIFFVSTFVGTFLPASIGGDAVRAYSTAKLNVPGGDAVASVFMDRMLGVASILLMALAGLTLAGDLAGNRAIVTALFATAIVCVVTLVLIFSAGAAEAAAALTTRLPAAVAQAARKVLGSVRSYRMRHAALTLVLVCSVAVQVLRVLQAYCLGRALGIEAAAGAYFAFIPLILLVMLLPVTINGIGTSQAAFVWFFGRVGVEAAPAFALSILFVALGIVGNLPGALLYALGDDREASQVR
jgi:uncharacterized protein (TIRG00374 family)